MDSTPQIVVKMMEKQWPRWRYIPVEIVCVVTKQHIYNQGKCGAPPPGERSNRLKHHHN